MEDLDKQLQGMKQNVTGLQVWDTDTTTYYKASGDDAYDYADGIDSYSYSNGENIQKLFDFIGKNQDTIKTIGGVAGGLAGGGGGTKPCRGLFGGALKRKLGRCQDALEPTPYVAPEKSNTGLYIGIGVGVLAIGIITTILIVKNK